MSASSSPLGHARRICSLLQDPSGLGASDGAGVTLWLPHAGMHLLLGCGQSFPSGGALAAKVTALLLKAGACDVGGTSGKADRLRPLGLSQVARTGPVRAWPSLQLPKDRQKKFPPSKRLHGPTYPVQQSLLLSSWLVLTTSSRGSTSNAKLSTWVCCAAQSCDTRMSCCRQWALCFAA